MYRAIIAGGRDFANYQVLKTAMDELLSDLIESGEEVVIVSGTAKGADQLGERYAKERNFDIHYYPAKWDRQADGTFDKGAGYKRNALMADNAEACVCFWSGTKGTKHMIDLAKRKGIQTVVLDYDGLEYANM